MTNKTIRNIIMTANNELIPLITIPRDKYTTIILFTLFVVVSIFIQIADKLGDKIEAAVIKLRAEITAKNYQLEKQTEQLKVLNEQLEKQAEQLKALNEQLEKQAEQLEKQ